jgi:hypothetical protein
MQFFDDIADAIKRIFGHSERKEPVQVLEKKPDRYGEFLEEMRKELD